MLEQLSWLFATRGVPDHLRSDNGPEFTAEVVRGWLECVGVKTLFIEPGSPWENGYVESFNGKPRDGRTSRAMWLSAARRPRSRGHEVALTSYERFQSPPRRQSSIVRKLINGISTRKYTNAVEDFTEGYGISKSAVSRELVAATRDSLQSLCERRLDTIGRLAVLLIDGKPIKGECVVVALGVDIEGKKHMLGLVQGGTENSTVVQHLLDDLIDRGLDPKQKMLLVLDGGKALRKAVKKMFGDDCPVQRCQLHKRRNVAALLPKEYQASIGCSGGVASEP